MSELEISEIEIYAKNGFLIYHSNIFRINQIVSITSGHPNRVTIRLKNDECSFTFNNKKRRDEVINKIKHTLIANLNEGPYR